MAWRSAQVVVTNVWDAPTRWFHWINAVSVVTLMALGLVLLNDGALGMSNDGKVLVKTLHVWVGYLFAGNLSCRLVWAFIGNDHARWRAFLPVGRGYLADVRRYTVSLLAGRPRSYQGHNPLGRLAITLLLTLMLVQAVSGLVLAGTDLYYPPFGRWIAEWVAAPGVDPSRLVPYQSDLLDAGAYQGMRSFRAPFVETHELTFFVLAALAVIHVVAVAFTELWEGGTLVSAMFTGRKVLFAPPVDTAGEDAGEPGENGETGAGTDPDSTASGRSEV